MIVSCEHGVPVSRRAKGGQPGCALCRAAQRTPEADLGQGCTAGHGGHDQYCWHCQQQDGPRRVGDIVRGVGPGRMAGESWAAWAQRRAVPVDTEGESQRHTRALDDHYIVDGVWVGVDIEQSPRRRREVTAAISRARDAGVTGCGRRLYTRPGASDTDWHCDDPDHSVWATETCSAELVWDCRDCRDLVRHTRWDTDWTGHPTDYRGSPW